MKKFLAVLIILILIIAIVVLFMLKGGLGFGKGKNVGSGTDSGTSSSAAVSESSDSESSVESSEESSESSAEESAAETVIEEKTYVDVTVSENSYLYQNNAMELDALLAELEKLDAGVIVRIGDQNASLKAYEDLTAALGEKDITFEDADA